MIIPSHLFEIIRSQLCEEELHWHLKAAAGAAGPPAARVCRRRRRPGPNRGTAAAGPKQREVAGRDDERWSGSAAGDTRPNRHRL